MEQSAGRESAHPGLGGCDVVCLEGEVDGRIYFKHKDDLGWEPDREFLNTLLDGYYISQDRYLQYLLTGSWNLKSTSLRSKE